MKKLQVNFKATGERCGDVVHHSEIKYLQTLDSEAELVFDDESYSSYITEQASELANQKYSNAQEMILGNKKRMGKIYDRKYNRAIKGDYSETERSAIIAKHKAQLHAEDEYLDMIETARNKIERLVKTGKYARALKALKKLEKFGVETKQEDIEKVFK